MTPDQTATAVDALTAVLQANDAYRRLTAYATLINHLTDEHGVVPPAAVLDGACGRVVPIRAFYDRCLSDPTRQAEHTVDNCRWADAEDQKYPRYPLIDACWAGGVS